MKKQIGVALLAISSLNCWGMQQTTVPYEGQYDIKEIRAINTKKSQVCNFTQNIQALVEHKKNGTLSKAYSAYWDEVCEKITDKVPAEKKDSFQKLVSMHSSNEDWDRPKLNYAFAGILALLSSEQDSISEIEKAFGKKSKTLYTLSNGYQSDYKSFRQLKGFKKSLFNEAPFLFFPFYETFFSFDQYFQALANKVSLFGISFHKHNIHGGAYKQPVTIFLHDLLHESLVGAQDVQAQNVALISRSINKVLIDEKNTTVVNKIKAGWFIIIHESLFLQYNIQNLINNKGYFPKIFEGVKKYLSDRYDHSLASDEKNYLECKTKVVYEEFLEYFYDGGKVVDSPSFTDVSFSIENAKNEFNLIINYQEKTYSDVFLDFLYEKRLRYALNSALKYAGYPLGDDDPTNYDIKKTRQYLLDLISFTENWSMLHLYESLA